MARKLAIYSPVIKQVLAPYETLKTNQSDVELIFDDDRMRYIVMRVGWLQQKRLHLCLIHIDITDEAVIIQCNNTEDMVATKLVDLGIPKELIRLGFLPPGHQRFEPEVEAEDQLASIS